VPQIREPKDDPASSDGRKTARDVLTAGGQEKDPCPAEVCREYGTAGRAIPKERKAEGYERANGVVGKQREEYYFIFYF